MENLRIAVDAMGGDNAPAAPVEGAVTALKNNTALQITLLGDEKRIGEELGRLSYGGERLSIVHCTEEIAMAEPPVMAIQKKKDSSIVKGMTMVRRGEADAFVSAGNTGAVLVGGQLIVGKLKGVERPAIAALMPSLKGMSLLIDSGANVDARPTMLVQFAEMGSIYMKKAMGIENPTVGIVNIGAEEEKGNALVKETFPLLKACDSIHFIGSVEARDIPAGGADVIVTDAFSGNIIMKMYEGTATALLEIVRSSLKSSLSGMIGGALVKGPLKKALKPYDASQYGGAPLLGLKGLVVKAHGSSKAFEFNRALEQCVVFHRQDVNSAIGEQMAIEGERIREMKRLKKAEAAGGHEA